MPVPALEADPRYPTEEVEAMTVAAAWNDPSDFDRLKQLWEVWRGQRRVSESLQELEMLNNTEDEDAEISKQRIAAQQGAVAVASMLGDDETTTLEAVEMKLTIALALGGPPMDHPPRDDLEAEEQARRLLLVSALQGVKSLRKRQSLDLEEE